MKYIKTFESANLIKLKDNILSDKLKNEFEYYKREYSRQWDERLEEDFIKILNGYPIKITPYDTNKRDEIDEEYVLKLQNVNDILFYKAYLTVEEIQKNPTKYDFVAPMWRDKDSLAWVVHNIKEVKNLDNNILGGLSVILKDGGGSSLGYMFLVDYKTAL